MSEEQGRGRCVVCGLDDKHMPLGWDGDMQMHYNPNDGRELECEVARVSASRDRWKDRTKEVLYYAKRWREAAKVNKALVDYLSTDLAAEGVRYRRKRVEIAKEIRALKAERDALKVERDDYRLLAERFFLTTNNQESDVLQTEQGRKWFDDWCEAMLIFIKE